MSIVQPIGVGGANEIDYANPISVTGAVTATIGKLHLCSGSTYTTTLPAVSGNSGKSIAFIMLPTLTGLLTLDGNALETINGSTIRIMRANESCLLYCNGTEWKKLAGLSIPMNATMVATNNQNFSAATLTKIVTDVSIVDNTGLMTDTTNKKITVNRPGIYRCKASIQYNYTHAGACTVHARLHKNGTVDIAANVYIAANQYAGPVAEGRRVLSVGDYFELYGYFDTSSFTGAATLSSGAASDFTSMEIYEEVSW